jgi:predicted small metal-binding protein
VGEVTGLEMRCPACNYMACGETEEDVKAILLQHSTDEHKMKRNDFESIFSEMRVISHLFKP